MICCVFFASCYLPERVFGDEHFEAHPYISKRAGFLGPVTGSQFVLVISAVGVLYLQQLTIQLPYTQDVCNNGENAIMVLSCASIMAIQLGSIGSHRSLGWVAKTCGCQGLGSRVSLQSVWAWKLQRGPHHKPALTYSLSHEVQQPHYSAGISCGQLLDHALAKFLGLCIEIQTSHFPYGDPLRT